MWKRDPKPTLVVIALMFSYFAYTELRYAFFGQTTSATIIAATLFNEYSKRGSEPMLSIQYQFTDPSGTQRTETNSEPAPTLRPSAGETIDIQYCANAPGTSRLATNAHPLVIPLFLVALAGGLVLVSLHYAMRAKELPANVQSATARLGSLDFRV